MCPETLRHQFSKATACICFCWKSLQIRVSVEKSAHLPQASISCRVTEVFTCHLGEFDFSGLEQGTDRQETSFLNVKQNVALECV